MTKQADFDSNPQRREAASRRSPWWQGLLLFGNFLLGGYALEILWRWFVSPLGPRPIGYRQALGLTVFLMLFSSSAPSGQKHDFAYWQRQWTYGLFKIVVVLVLGWIVHLSMPR